MDELEQERSQSRARMGRMAFALAPAFLVTGIGMAVVSQAAQQQTPEVTYYTQNQEQAATRALHEIEQQYGLRLAEQRAHEVSARHGAGDVIPLGEDGARILYSPDTRSHPLPQQGYLEFAGASAHDAYAIPVGSSRLDRNIVQEMLLPNIVNLPETEIYDVAAKSPNGMTPELVGRDIEAGLSRERQREQQVRSRDAGSAGLRMFEP